MPPKVKLTNSARRLAKKARALELKRTRLMDHLKREINYGSTTRRRHEKNWKKLLTEITLKEYRDNFEFAWQSFEWAVDAKDCIISNLMDELDEANKQFGFNLKAHNKRFRTILNQLQVYMNSMKQYGIDQIEEMNARNKAQYEKCEKRFLEQQEALNLFIYIMNKLNDLETRERMTNYFCQVDFLTEEWNEKINFDIVYGTKIGQIRKTMENVIKDYNDKYQKCMLDTRKERAANETSNAEMRKNLRRIIYLLALIKKLQKKLTNLQRVDGKKLSELTETFEEFTDYLFILKNKLFKETRVDEAQLRLLVSSSQDTLRFFKETNRKGELIMQLFRVSKKYETNVEKVLTYPIDRTLKLNRNSFRDLLSKQMDMETRFHLFFQRIAQVEASRIALAEEKKALQLEQMNVKTQLEKYCGCLVCPGLYMMDIKRKMRNCLGTSVAIKQCKKNIFIQELALNDDFVNENG